MKMYKLLEYGGSARDSISDNFSKLVLDWGNVHRVHFFPLVITVQGISWLEILLNSLSNGGTLNSFLYSLLGICCTWKIFEVQTNLRILTNLHMEPNNELK